MIRFAQHDNRDRKPGRSLAVAWAVSVACTLFALAWLFFDPLAPRTVATFFDLHASSPAAALGAPGSQLLLIRALGALALATLVLVALGLFLGPPAHRGVRSWLAVTALVAFWLALAVTWQSLAAAGQAWRLRRQLDAFDALAHRLHADWPAHDGRVPGLGAFNAYPIGRPRTLLVIAADEQDAAAPVAAVERADDGDLRFELAGGETGAWLEWRPSGSPPASFTGGLDDRRELAGAVPLRPEWFLTRYHSQEDAAPPRQ